MKKTLHGAWQSSLYLLGIIKTICSLYDMKKSLFRKYNVILFSFIFEIYFNIYFNIKYKCKYIFKKIISTMFAPSKLTNFSLCSAFEFQATLTT